MASQQPLMWSSAWRGVFWRWTFEMGVALEPGSLLGVVKGSGEVRQRVSALDRPGQVKFQGAASFF